MMSLILYQNLGQAVLRLTFVSSYHGLYGFVQFLEFREMEVFRLHVTHAIYSVSLEIKIYCC